MDEILTEEDVSALLGCTVETVCERASSHELPAIKFGRAWRFPKSALIAALNEKAITHMATPKQRPERRAVKHGSTRPQLVGL